MGSPVPLLMARIAPPPARPRRLVFLGTPAAAVPPLRALVAAGFEIALVVTQPDRKRGRGGSLSPSPVKAAALELGLPVGHDVDAVLATDAELGVVVAFGRLIRPHVLDALPMVNLHFSLLPRWRGAAPVERALLAGDPETGVAVMAVEDTLDTGGIYAEARVAIGSTATADGLRDSLVETGTRLLVDALTAGLEPPRPQVGEPTYAEKLGPDDLALSFDRPARELDRIVRVGGAHTTFREKRLKVWAVDLDSDDDTGGAVLAPGALEGARVGCGDGSSLTLVEVQPEGKGRQSAADWLRGARPEPHERLGA